MTSLTFQCETCVEFKSCKFNVFLDIIRHHW